MTGDLTTDDERLPAGRGGRWYGVHTGLVTDVRDPANLGRVKVTLPWAPDPAGGRYEAWARLATLMAGPDRGSWFIPDPGDEVLLAFEAGDPRRPCIVGALWNGKAAPPATMDGAGRNATKVLKSRNGIVVTLDDTDGRETLSLETPGGQKVILRDGPGEIEIADANGNTVKLEASGITVTAAAKVTVTAAAVEVSAGTLTVNAGMSKFSGVVQADTVLTNTIVSAVYTPGAGNIW